MKILQVSRQFPPAVGGVPSVAYGLNQALKRKGHFVELVTLDSDFATGEKLIPDPALDIEPVHRVSFFGSKRYPITPQVLSYINSHDIIHIHCIDFFVDFLSWLRWFHRKPIVVSTHGGIFHTKWLWSFKQFYFKTATRFSLSGVDAVICDSQSDYETFQPIVPEHKLHLLYYGIEKVESLIKIEKKITPGLLLGIGRVSKNKCVHRVIEALPNLAQEFPDVKLVWIGNDPEGQIAVLTEKARTLGVESRVQFLGQASDQEITDLLSRCHLFVSAASHEGFGTTTVEAMGSATVPVVTPVGVHPEVITHGKTGFIINDENQAVLLTLRQALSLSTEELMQIGEQAREVAKDFLWDRVVVKYLSLYEKILRQRGR